MSDRDEAQGSPAGETALDEVKPDINTAADEGVLAPDSEGGSDFEDEAVEDVPREQLLESARQHMLETACTLKNEDTNTYEYLPICGTGPTSLGRYGVGVQLYFQFMCQAGVVLLLMFILQSPALAFNIMGTMVDEGSPFYNALGSLSIANLGVCPSTGCVTDDDRRNRCAIRNSEPCEMGYKVLDITQWLGLLDGIAILFFMAFGIFFSSCWIPRAVRKNDSKNITVADYTVSITGLPRKLTEGHADYEEKLVQHILSVLKTAEYPVDDADAVREVVLVREYNGAIKKFMYKGEQLQELAAAKVLLERAKSTPGKEALVAKRQKRVDSYKERIRKIDRSLRAQARMVDSDREVCMAFVTFNRESYKEKLVYEYRFTQYTLFRCCLRPRLRFDGHLLSVAEASEPSNLNWENLDFSNLQRVIRKAIVLLLTFIILIVCSGLLVSLQSMQRSTTASPPQSPAWVLMSRNRTNPLCLRLCDFVAYDDNICYDQSASSLSPQWGGTLFDAHGNFSTTRFQGNADCNSKSWTSPACAGGTPGQVSTNDWIGLQLSSPKRVSCVKATQTIGGNQHKEMQLYACRKTIPFDNIASWDPTADCEPMAPVKTLTTVRSGAIPTGPMKQALDTSCAVPVSLAAAQLAKDTASNAAQDLTYSCFCQQQEKMVGIQFRLPPYTSEAQKLCQTWSDTQNTNLARLIGAVIAVLILNQVLLLVYGYLIEWERHCTITDLTTSQLWKLFLAQFVNTGVLVLLVNANLKDVPAGANIIKVLSIGSGTYDDLSPAWFISVGSGVILTIAIQVFSTTVTPLIMSFVVQRILIRLSRGSAVTQDMMNKLYTLPPWDLSLRLAQSLNIIFVCVMYASGMPIMYAIAVVYCFVAYWLDKWCLLRGSCKPPAYKEHVVSACVNMFPFAAFLHSALGGWTLGKQSLFPSEWSELRWIAEAIFSMSMDRYNELLTTYPTASEQVQAQLQREYYKARFLDYARQGCWLLMLIFLAFAICYVVYYLWLALLKPFLQPVFFLLREFLSKFGCSCSCCCCCCRRRAETPNGEGVPFEEAAEEWKRLSLLCSYNMADNEKYAAAAQALEHTAMQVSQLNSEIGKEIAARESKTSGS